MELTTELQNEIFNCLQDNFDNHFYDRGCEDNAYFNFELGVYSVEIDGVFSGDSYSLHNIRITDNQSNEYNNGAEVDYFSEEHINWFHKVEEELSICTENINHQLAA